MKPVLIDSGPLIALFNKSDRYHEVSVEFIKINKRPIITSLANITEVVSVLDYSKDAQSVFLKWIANSSIIVEDIDSADIFEISQLFEKYRNVPMDFADACIVHIAEKLQTNEIATIDSDFDIYKINGKKTFKNVLKT